MCHSAKQLCVYAGSGVWERIHRSVYTPPITVVGLDRSESSFFHMGPSILRPQACNTIKDQHIRIISDFFSVSTELLGARK